VILKADRRWLIPIANKMEKGPVGPFSVKMMLNILLAQCANQAGQTGDVAGGVVGMDYAF
jgi:hypothetical protein